MKKLFSWMTIALMAFACVSFTACGGSDDNDNGGGGNGAGERSLVGSWKKIYESNNSGGNFYEEDKAWDEAADGVIFKGDGTCQEVRFAGDLSVERVKTEYTLKFVDGHMYTRKVGKTDEDDWKDRCVWKVSSDILTLDKIHNDKGGSGTYNSIAKYRKIP